MITYNSLTKKHKFSPFLHYYLLYRINKPSTQVYMEVYTETIEALEDKPISVFDGFIEAWLEDAFTEESTIGPNFSICVEKYFQFKPDLFLTWIREAAVRDMIFNLPINDNNTTNLKKLKEILKDMTLLIRFPE